MDFHNRPGTSQKTCRICQQDIGDQYQPRGTQRNCVLKLISEVWTFNEFMRSCAMCLQCLRQLTITYIYSNLDIILEEKTDDHIESTPLSNKEIAAADLILSIMNKAEEVYDKLDKFFSDTELTILTNLDEAEEPSLLDLSPPANYPALENVLQSTDMATPMDIGVNEEYFVEGEQEVLLENIIIEPLEDIVEDAPRAVVPLRKPRRPRSKKSINILCNVCKKVFKYKGALIKHEATHTEKGKK